MKFKSVAAAAAWALAGGSALAVGPGNLGAIDNTPIVIGNSVAGPLLFDVYTFSLVNPGFLDGIATSLDLSGVLGLVGFSVVLQDSGFNTIGVDTSPADGFSFAGLSAGSYALTFVGVTNGSLGGSYAGVILAQTIPEPETYALMLAGLAAVGFVAMRRRQRD